MTRLVRSAWLMAMLFVVGAEAQRYDGPRPPKPDLPYLVHADNLVPTDASQATEESRKDATAYAVSGAAATARTPMAEPVFLLEAKSLDANKLGLFRMDVKNGRREVVIPARRGRGGPKSYRLSVARVADGLYRLEAAETLEPGEYSLSPDGSNQVFSFQVY